jgi:hypothetical protein
MKRAAVFIFAVMTSVGAIAQQPAGWSTYLGTGQSPLQDPFYISPVLPAPYGPAGYVQVSCTPSAGAKVVVVMGQSLAENTANDNYAVVNPTKNITFNSFDGNCYQSKYTLVATQSNIPFNDCCGSYLARMADNLISIDGVSQVILIPPINQQLDGSLIANWSSSVTPPYLINNIAVIARRLAATGLTPTEIVWELGSSDAEIPTSQAAYTAGLAKIIAAIRSVWPTTPILINTESFNGTTTVAGIQAAQASFIDNVTIFPGANTDTITASGRYIAQPGQTPLHFNATGAATAASLLEAAVLAH